MTVHARRYGRWCREHCDEKGRPLPQPDAGEAAEAAPAPEGAESGENPAAEKPS